jgi:hypothetical protein
MDIGYVILLLLVLVHACAAAVLYLRARNAPSGRGEAQGVLAYEAQGVLPDEAQDEPPEEAEADELPRPGNGGEEESPAEGPGG